MPNIGVVTKAEPDATNLAVALDVYEQVKEGDASNDYLGEYRRIDPIIALHLREPVFYVGEILILGEDGREVGYPGRKPDKWGVDVVIVDNLIEAADLAREVMDLRDFD